MTPTYFDKLTTTFFTKKQLSEFPPLYFYVKLRKGVCDESFVTTPLLPLYNNSYIYMAIGLWYRIIRDYTPLAII